MMGFLILGAMCNWGIYLVVKPGIKIKVEAARTRLDPLGAGDNIKISQNVYRIDFSKVRKTTVTVKVMDANNKPVKDYSFTISALVVPYSGGHDHDNNRPVGRFVKSNNDTLSSFSDKTDENGMRTYTYLSSGFGGIDSIFVKGQTDKDTASVKILLKRDDFQLMQDGERYDLIGAYGEPGVISQHRVNHYGKQALINKLIQLADSAYADSSYILQYNDMSLVNGGPFDIKNNWSTPHNTHREGTNVDIRTWSADENNRALDKKYIKRLVTKKFDGKFLDEGNHFHLTF